MNYFIKIAEYSQEYDQINQLNYQTFVEEIPQHSAHQNSNQILVDKFDDQNSYFIAKSNNNVIGMLAFRSQRPFSLDFTIPDLDKYIHNENKYCEVRLLSVKKEFRNSNVALSLITTLIEYAMDRGCNAALISAYKKQIPLYRKFGCKSFSQPTIINNLEFQPMYVELTKLLFPYKYYLENIDHNFKTSYFTPGPVNYFPHVRKTMLQPPIHHRSDNFKQLLIATKDKINHCFNSKSVEIFFGGGTLANDMIPQLLASNKRKGLIISNGEFGKRLIDQATAVNVNFESIIMEWGVSFDYHRIERKLKSNKSIKWLWAVHSETSTGMLNDIKKLELLTKKFEVKLCLDCISSIGNIELDLSNIFLASASSSKGLGTFSGLSLVFYDPQISYSNEKVPFSLNLNRFIKECGITSTLSSHLLQSISKGLEWINNFPHYKRVMALNLIIREYLDDLSISCLLSSKNSNPSVITIDLPEHISSYDVGEQFFNEGVLINYNSKYLQDNNWIQICLMGYIQYRDIIALLNSLNKIFNKYSNSTS